MAGPFYVDDGGDGSDGLSWATAYTSINALDTAVALASGDIVYFGHDSQCQATNSANLTITGPASGAPVIFISATTGSNPPTYQQATGNQIDTTEGAYSVTFDGSFALYGIKINSGGTSAGGISFSADANETSYHEDCIFVCAAAQQGIDIIGNNGKSVAIRPVIDLNNDGTTNRAQPVLRNYMGNPGIIIGMTFVNAAYRTDTIFNAQTNIACKYYSGCDFSGFTNATLCEFFPSGITASTHEFMDCKTAATWAASNGAFTVNGARVKFVNCGNGDQPVSLLTQDYLGSLSASSTIYRSSGATVEGTNTAWMITTNAVCTKDSPFYSEYIYGRITATGSKTFDLYVTNDTADLNNDQIWLEVEYKADASSGEWTLITDKPADRTTAAAAQTDDVTSTWNGTGPSFTYKQKLSVTATVNTTGLYRARVAVGKASVASSAFLYCDPLVTVS